MKYIIYSLLFLLFGCASAGPSAFRQRTIIIKSEPAQADVLLNAYYVGKTPLEIRVNSNEKNFLYISKTGFIGQRFDLNSRDTEVKIILTKE